MYEFTFMFVRLKLSRTFQVAAVAVVIGRFEILLSIFSNFSLSLPLSRPHSLSSTYVHCSTYIQSGEFTLSARVYKVLYTVVVSCVRADALSLRQRAVCTRVYNKVRSFTLRATKNWNELLFLYEICVHRSYESNRAELGHVAVWQQRREKSECVAYFITSSGPECVECVRTPRFRHVILPSI